MCEAHRESALRPFPGKRVHFEQVASWTLTLSVCFEKSMAEVARCLFLRKGKSSVRRY